MLFRTGIDSLCEISQIVAEMQYDEKLGQDHAKEHPADAFSTHGIRAGSRMV